MSNVVFFSLVVLGVSIFYLVKKKKEEEKYKINQQQIIQNFYIKQNILYYNYENTYNNQNIVFDKLNKIFSYDSSYKKNKIENSYFRDDYETPKFKKYKNKL